MHKKGFISSYFLVIFLWVSALTAVNAMNDRNRAAAAGNIIRANELLSQEIAAISTLKCQLQKTGRLSDGEYQNGDVRFFLQHACGSAQIDILAPFPETLYVTYDPASRHILDYESDRPES